MATPTAPDTDTCGICNGRGWFEDGICPCPAGYTYTDAIAKHNDAFTKALLGPGGFEDEQ